MDIDRQVIERCWLVRLELEDRVSRHARERPPLGLNLPEEESSREGHGEESHERGVSWGFEGKGGKRSERQASTRTVVWLSAEKADLEDSRGAHVLQMNEMREEGEIQERIIRESSKM